MLALAMLKCRLQTTDCADCGIICYLPIIICPSIQYTYDFTFLFIILTEKPYLQKLP